MPTVYDIAVKKILSEPAGYGQVWRDVSRPGHTVQRFLFDGARGEVSQVRVVAFTPSQSLALDLFRAWTTAQGTVVRLVGELNLVSYQGFMGSPRLDRLVAVGSTDPAALYRLDATLPFTATEVL